MHRIERFVAYGLLVLATANFASAEPDHTWRKDPEPRIQAFWEKATAAQLELDKIMRQIEREEYLRLPPETRLNKAESKWLILTTEIEAMSARLKIMREKREKIDALRKAEREKKGK